jgi:hypothetical protein
VTNPIQFDHVRLQGFFTSWKNESDRGCAIIGLCLLEDFIEKIYEHLLPNPTPKTVKLFTAGNLDQVIARTLALGLMDSEEATLFRRIAAIRNLFAHGGFDAMKFTDPEISKLVYALPDGINLQKHVRQFNAWPKDNPRGMFILCLTILNSLLNTRVHQVRRMPATP